MTNPPLDDPPAGSSEAEGRAAIDPTQLTKKGGRQPGSIAEGAKAARASRRLTRRKQAELLLSVTNRLAAHHTLQDQLTTLIDITTSALGAERGSLFLNDLRSGELYSRVAHGDSTRELRVANSSGLAGFVYTAGEGIIVDDAYSDPRFNRAIDEQTGFVTRSVLSCPVRTVSGDIIGVAQALNKIEGRFDREDLELLEAMTTQAAIAIQSALYVEQIEQSREKELEFLGIVSELSSELHLGPLLQKIMRTVTKLLNAERSTLFLNDPRSSELYTEVGEGLGATKIRFPNHLGIAGTVFSTGESVSIPYAYADLRFNPAFDRQTGYFTRSILCVPVINKVGRVIGVTQVLNKIGGTFTAEDESRLKAFTAQISIGLENAKLFDDVQNMKNYNDAILESMSNGVITTDALGRVVTCNAAGLHLMKVGVTDILNKPSVEVFWGKNAWIADKIREVLEHQKPQTFMDASTEFKREEVSLNLTVLPLVSVNSEKLGTMLMMDDISAEKRMKSTMSRYMDATLADKLLKSGEELLGGQSSVATVLFSDLRQFTTLSEGLGPQGTVNFLNEYFTLMVDCIQTEGGMLDKFIGDSIMAVFGVPFAHEDDVDRAVRCACAMVSELARFNTRRQELGKRPVEMGIGLNTDVIVSGNIGSPKRMDYTVIGDGVNLASRLEGACKQYSTRILASEFTVKQLHGIYRMREIDRVVVTGKTEPVSIHEVLDYHTDETFPNMAEVIGHSQNGLRRYRQRRFDEAIRSFTQALTLNPSDSVSKLYVERCQYLKANPPPDDWNGVWVMTSK